MKLLRADNHQLVFQLGKGEQQLFLDIVRLYPLVPPAHHRLHKSTQTGVRDDSQRLLEDSLAVHRAENRRHVQAMLAEPQRFRKTDDGFELTLSPAQAEWLLQVLNDVRVGSWLALGEPGDLDTPRVDESNAGLVMAMEAAGYFEAMLVEGFGDGSERRAERR